MEDIQRKLEVDNSYVRIQAINKLLMVIEKSKPLENPISGSTPNIPELDLLWDLTDIENPATSNAAALSLVSLALHRHAEVGYVLNGILNRLTSAVHFNGLIGAIKEILLAQAFDAENPSFYDTRLTQFPFVVILRQNSLTWPYILEHTKSMLSLEENREQIFKILTPFLQYVLFDPNHPSTLAIMRISLYHFLVDTYLLNQNEFVFDFLISSIQWLKVESVTELNESCEMLQILANSLIRNDASTLVNSQITRIALSLCTIICQMLKLDLDPTSGMQTLRKLIIKQQVNIPNTLTDGLALLIGQMMDFSAPSYHNILTKITESLIHQGWTSPLIAYSFLLPLLHIVSLPLVITMDGKPSAQKQASSLIRYIEKNITSTTSKKSSIADVDLTNYESLDSSLAQALQMSSLAQKLQNSTQVSLWWLENVESKLKNINHDWHFVAHLLSGFIMFGMQDRQLIKKAVSLMVTLAQADKTQASNIFPLFLHKIGNETDVDLRLHIMHCLPDVATHKICIGPVLQTLQMLSCTPHLQALALRLTARLWQNQERVFPFLHHLILEKVDENQIEVYDATVAKAASLKDICETRPQQHGADCLPALSFILAKNLHEAGVVPSVLALDGVIALCKEEVIDLRTTWKVLAPKLSKDHRPLVIRKLCELLALAPSLEVESNEFTSFKCECVSWLWKQVCANKDPIAVGAAYRALGVYPPDLYKPKSLPEEAKKYITLPQSLAATPYEAAKKPEDVLLTIPGICFSQLLKTVPRSIILDYGNFLSSQLREEIKNLPRGVYHSALRTNRVTQSNKVLAEIPALLAKKYEYNKIVGLQGSLAGGVLLSYEPPVEYGNDKQPLSRSFANQARAYQTKLEVLLNEVPIGAAEWQRSLALCQGWTAYIERAYFVCVEGRKAELEMQKKHGTLKNPDDFEPLTQTAWLWARDTMCDILRGATKGKPAAQGNTIIALGGLAAAVNKFTGTLESDSWKTKTKEESEHLDHLSWVSIVLETILHVLTSGRPSKGRIFTWFQGADKSGSGSLSMLVRACSAYSLSQLTPYMASSCADRIPEVVEILQNTLRDSESPALQLYAGLGLGFFVSHLYQQRYGESGGTEANEFLAKTAKSLLQWALSDDMDNKVGSVLGLTTAACAMCLDSNVDSRLNAADIQTVIMEKIETEDEASVIHEVLCLAAVCVTCVACSTQLLAMDVAEAVLLKLEGLLKNTPNNCGVAASLGLLVYWLQRMSYSSAPEMKDHLLKVWLPVLASEQAPTLNRLASIHGLCALFGMQSSLMLLPETYLKTSSSDGLNELLNIMSQIISLSKDIGMQNCSAWMLGQVYAVSSREGSSRTSMPVDYSYLNSSNILRAILDLVIELSKAEKLDSNDGKSPLYICLCCLSEPFHRPLPPLDWGGILTPIFQRTTDELLQSAILKIAINQSASSPPAATLVTSLLADPIFKTLSSKLQLNLFEAIPQLIVSIPLSKTGVWINSEIIPVFKSNSSDEKKLAALKGLKLGLQNTDMPKDCRELLRNTCANLYPFITEKDNEIFSTYCELSVYLTDVVLDNLTTSEGVEKAVSIRSHLIKVGKQPLNWLNDIIEIAATQKCNKHYILTILFNDLQQLGESQPDICQSWLLSLMGMTKNIMDWKSSMNIQSVDHMCAVVNFFVELFSTVVVSWACCLISVPICLFPEQTKPTDLLPVVFANFFRSEHFASILSKVIDWFFVLIDKGVLTERVAQILKAALLSVRQSKEFSKAVLWTQIVNL